MNGWGPPGKAGDATRHRKAPIFVELDCPWKLIPVGKSLTVILTAIRKILWYGFVGRAGWVWTSAGKHGGNRRCAAADSSDGLYCACYRKKYGNGS